MRLNRNVDSEEWQLADIGGASKDQFYATVFLEHYGQDIVMRSTSPKAKINRPAWSSQLPCEESTGNPVSPRKIKVHSKRS